MRSPIRTFGIAVASAALLVASPTPAMADDGHIYVHVQTYPSGGAAFRIFAIDMTGDH